MKKQIAFRRFWVKEARHPVILVTPSSSSPRHPRHPVILVTPSSSSPRHPRHPVILVTPPSSSPRHPRHPVILVTPSSSSSSSPRHPRHPVILVTPSSSSPRHSQNKLSKKWCTFTVLYIYLNNTSINGVSRVPIVAHFAGRSACVRQRPYRKHT